MTAQSSSILNLTQHKSTPEQNCIDLPPVEFSYLQSCLTFEEIPTEDSLVSRALCIAQIAENHSVKFAMIGGALFFMPYLVSALRARNILPFYAFSQRVIISEADGQKTSQFKHLGFIEAK